MAVSASNGSLEFVSTLDNSDFKNKSLEDLRLIKLRLELTGDTSGIKKYDEAVKSALATETKLRNDLAKILQEAKIQTEEYTAEITKPVSRTIFSDSALEVEAYRKSLEVLAETGNVALSGADVLLNKFNEDLAAGIITIAEYDDRITAMAESQAFFNTQIQQSDEAILTEIGAIEALTIKLTELKEAKFSAPAIDLPVINSSIQKTEQEITRLSNVGKTGFDEFGNAVQNAEPKVSKISATVSRLTNIQNIASRAITQFSRQIIGLGVGFISLEIGAKAIQGLITYVENLDVFTGRLDIAVQSLKALKDAEEETAKTAGAQLAPLRQLYDETQNVAVSMKERLAAAEQLREIYPAEFENATNLAIVNGQLKGSYDELTASIIENAKAEAIKNKIGEQATKIVGAQIEIANINKKHNDEIAALQKGPQTSYNPYGGGTVTTGFQQIASDQRAKSDIAAQQDIINTANGTIKVIESVVKARTKAGEELADANLFLGNNLEKFDSVLANATNETLLKKVQSALQTKLASLGLGDAQIASLKAKLKQVDDLLKQYQVKASPTIDPSIQAGKDLLASETAIQEKIAALKDKFASKDKTRNEQAADEIVAIFKAQVDAINAANKKYDDYVAKFGQKAADKAGLKRIDPTQLQAAQQNALAGLAGTQSVEDTKLQVDAQKQIYTDYEAFKLKAGEDAANKLYSTQLANADTYVNYLKSLQPTIDELNSPDAYVKARASKLSDFLKTEIAAANNEELKEQQRHLEELISQNESYVQQRNNLILKSIEDNKALTQAGDLQGAAQNDSDLQEQLTQLDEANFKKLQLYKDLFDGIKTLTAKQAKDDLDALFAKAEDDKNHARITTEAYLVIVKQLTQASAALKGTLIPQTISEIGSALTTLGNDIGKTNTNLGSIISSAGDAFTSISKIMDLQAEIADTNTSDTDKLKDEIAVVAIAADAAISIINEISAAAKARQKAETDYYNNIIDFQNQYNLALIQQQQLQYQTQGNIFETNFAKQLADGALAYTQATAAYKQALLNLTAGQAIVGTKNVVNAGNVAKTTAQGAVAGAVIGGIPGAIIGGGIGLIAGLFGGKTPENVLRPLLTIYPQLVDSTGKFNEALAKSLVATNQVTDATKVLLNNTISYYDQAQSAIDQINSALSTLSGNLASSLDEALVGAFENGSDAAKAFGDTVSDVIGNIIQQFLFQDIFNSQFDALNTKLKATVLAGGGSGDITKDFLDFFKQAGPLVQQFQDGLKAAQQAGATQGLTLFQPTTTGGAPTTASGAIQAALTENTAELVEGTLKGIQLNTFNTNLILQSHSLSFSQMIGIAQRHLDAVLQIQISSQRTADNSDALPNILNVLKSIDTNTASSAQTELRAGGKYGY